MKKIEAIVRPEKLEPLKEALSLAKIKGMTISQVQGCGNQLGHKEFFRGSEIFINMLSKIKFEIIAESDQVDEIIEIIVRTSHTGEPGDGKIFVMPLDDIVRIRTGEKGKAAI